MIGVGVNAVTSSTKGKGACFQLQSVALMYMYRTMYILRFLYTGVVHRGVGGGRREPMRGELPTNGSMLACSTNDRLTEQ